MMFYMIAYKVTRLSDNHEICGNLPISIHPVDWLMDMVEKHGPDMHYVLLHSIEITEEQYRRSSQMLVQL